MLTPVRRRLAGLAMVLLVPTVGACGFGYQTDQVYQPGVGVNDRSGTVDVLGAVVVSSTDGSGTFVSTLVNNSLDEPATLTAVTGEDGVQAEVVKPVEVDPDSLVNLAEMGAVRVTGEPVKAGGFVKLTLQFDNGDKVQINVPVVEKNDEYSGVRPAIPAPSATP
jgi:copper(I)-binding protein